MIFFMCECSFSWLIIGLTFPKIQVSSHFRTPMFTCNQNLFSSTFISQPQTLLGLGSLSLSVNKVMVTWLRKRKVKTWYFIVPIRSEQICINNCRDSPSNHTEKKGSRKVKMRTIFSLNYRMFAEVNQWKKNMQSINYQCQF